MQCMVGNLMYNVRQPGAKPVFPITFIDKLKILNDRFVVPVQQDLDEFLQLLLVRMISDGQRCSSCLQVTNMLRNSTSGSEDLTIIDHSFNMKLVTDCICENKTCGYVSRSENTSENIDPHVHTGQTNTSLWPQAQPLGKRKGIINSAENISTKNMESDDKDYTTQSTTNSSMNLDAATFPVKRKKIDEAFVPVRDDQDLEVYAIKPAINQWSNDFPDEASGEDEVLEGDDILQNIPMPQNENRKKIPVTREFEDSGQNLPFQNLPQNDQKAVIVRQVNL
ncbi:unnamed protein product [Didymodactylos carnosus]|uniref:Uncharacterized protein n=1 Tax=Didymodactylos carnosus TaxID=1234261 RepID=A0A814SWA2_9BILA|nr:unnamed protein product [Didymodactylos carnosus]CAF3916881.1 unnamed protein product [Didymodactylos carnosus]